MITYYELRYSSWRFRVVDRVGLKRLELWAGPSRKWVEVNPAEYIQVLLSELLSLARENEDLKLRLEEAP